MAFDPATFNIGGYAASAGLPDLSTEGQVSMFSIDPVQFQIQTAAEFVSLQVQNNIMIIALVSGRLIRINLNAAHEYVDIDLPKSPNEIGVIMKTFLDPSGNHFLITTTTGENYYLHACSEKPKQLSKLRGYMIEAVAWSPYHPSGATREILIGTTDGNILEVFLEPSDDFYRREERYVKQVYQFPGKTAIRGMHVDVLQAEVETRRVLVATDSDLLHFVGKTGKGSHSEPTPIYARFFVSEFPIIHSLPPSRNPILTISPRESKSYLEHKAHFAWLTGLGVFHGQLKWSPASQDLGKDIFDNSHLMLNVILGVDSSDIADIALTRYHLVCLCGQTIYIVNIANETLVFQETISSTSKFLGLSVDESEGTVWILGASSILEISITDESRDMWKVFLLQDDFEVAARFAKSKTQQDNVAIAWANSLAARREFIEAGRIWGGSTKKFEEVALLFLEQGQPDALREYLLAKLSNSKATSFMQKTMLATWLVEIFASKLNSLDDAVSAKTETGISIDNNVATELEHVREEFQDFIRKNSNELDQKTTYDIISSHGREEELLFFARTINDYNFVLSYWVQREKWQEALGVLKRLKDPEIFYKYATVLLANSPIDTVEVWMRQDHLNANNLVPALLNYSRQASESFEGNQAVRYLLHVIRSGNIDSAVHNTLLSIYAANVSNDESDLLAFLESSTKEPHYDIDFALRLCIEFNRVLSCVHIYSSMSLYEDAVGLALKNGNVKLASAVADRPEDDKTMRKKLWLSIAKKVISQDGSIKSALDFLCRNELVAIEDILPLFPEFVIIDDFKDEICTALEEYSRHIDILKVEMENSAQTAAHIRADKNHLDLRYAIVEPGERCFLCRYPLLSRQFFVFPCQHAFHSDCLTTKLVHAGGVGKSRRIKDLQNSVVQTTSLKDMEELGFIVANACTLCSEVAVKTIDDPFIIHGEYANDWVL